jgi:hypothetical protein
LLEGENARLKTLLAKPMLDNAMLREIGEARRQTGGPPFISARYKR